MLKLVFVSNYLNHHQIPFCNAMCRLLSEDFAFIQTEAMEEERVRMGWQSAEGIPYLKYYYKEPQECRQLIETAEVVLFGGTDEESYIVDRLRAGKPVIRYCERLYKTGQWKAVSPRGLIKKYQDHTRYRKAPVYLLCAGAYVPSDFHIVRAYPGKMLCWGYFPETKHYDVEKLLDGKGYQERPYLLWAARFIDWKHPELALQTARHLKDKGLDFHMDVVGGGAMEEEMKALHKELGLEDCVTLVGFQTPAQVRERMERADIYLLTSDRQEGWGAVANEAMNSGCALVADHMVGAAPYLIRQGYNGYVYQDGKRQMLFETVEKLVRDPKLCKELGRHAYQTITEVWNAENAAEKLVEFIRRVVLADSDGGKRWGCHAEENTAPTKTPETGEAERGQRNLCFDGLVPCAPAPVIPERDMFRRMFRDHRSWNKEEKNIRAQRSAQTGVRMKQNDTPLLSIIVPVYNILEYLPRCVHSITAQTYRNLEIWLVDDGSTDGTGELCDALAGEDERIHVLHKENGGSSSARNLAVAQAKGEYFGFVDSDDYIEPDMYELLYRGIAEYGVKVAQTGRDELDEQGKKLPNICEPPGEPVLTGSEEFLRELLMHRGDCSFCTKLIHRELFAGREFPEGRLNEDFYLLVHMLADIDSILSLPEQSYHVFYRIGSNSRKADREQFSRVFGDGVDNADMVSEIVGRKYPSMEKVALRFGVFQRLEYLLHIPISQMTAQNEQYRAIVKWMRKKWIRGMCNPYLTLKNKCYHTLFAIAPKGIRVVHRKMKRNV